MYLQIIKARICKTHHQFFVSAVKRNGRALEVLCFFKAAGKALLDYQDDIS